MDLRPAAILARFRGKAFRYAGASVFGTVLTQVQLYLYIASLGWNHAVANVVAVTITCVPGYFLARYWVWRDRRGTALRRDAVAFWGMNLAGLALSTLFVVLAEQVTDAALVANVANLAGFGVLWLAKFLVLDEYVFKSDDVPLVEL